MRGEVSPFDRDVRIVARQVLTRAFGRYSRHMWPFTPKVQHWQAGFTGVMSQLSNRANLTFDEALELFVDVDTRSLLQFDHARCGHCAAATAGWPVPRP